MIIRAVCPVLVGREQELSTLEDALLAACRGEGSVMVLAGDAGMGKSRLASELERRAKKLGAAVMEGTCSEAELALPYLPFVEAIANYLETTNVGKLREKLGPAAPDLAHLFPQLGGGETSVQGEPTDAKLRVYEAVLALLKVAAGTTGLLLVVEDVHWADSATRELLDYVTRRIRNHQILVLATYRRGEMHPGHPLIPTIQAWERSRLARVQDLEPLPPADVARMVSAILDDPTRDETRDFFYHRCEGNPFVLEEMLKSALERGDIYRIDTGWARKPLSEFRIPDTVRASILQRVEHLDTTAAEILRAAAVLGLLFEPGVLQQVCAHGQAELEDAIETLTRLQLVEEERGPTTRYRFRHALTQETVYTSLSAPRRQRLHAQAADALKARDAPAVEIAHHLLAADRAREAVTYCLRAADQAEAAFAFREAAELQVRALPYEASPVERARLGARIGEHYWLAGDPRRAVDYLADAIKALEQAREIETAAHFRLILGRCFWELNREGEAIHEYESARRSVEPYGPSKDLALAYMRLGSHLALDYVGEQALTMLEQAIAIADEVGADDIRIWSYNFTGLALTNMGRDEEGIAFLDRSYAEAVEGELDYIASNALFNSASWRAFGLRAQENSDLIERFRELRSERENLPAEHVESLTCFFLGDLDQGLTVAQRRFEAVSQTTHLKSVGEAETILAHFQIELGRTEEAARLLRAPEQSDSAATVFPLADCWIRLQLAQGNVGEAARTAQLLLRHRQALASFPYLAERAVAALLAADDFQAARNLLTQALDLGTRRSNPWLMRAQARLALGKGDVHAAAECASRSVEQFSGAGYRLEELVSREVLAQALLAAGKQAPAEKELRVVVATARSIGAALIERQALRRLSEMGIWVEEPSGGSRDVPSPTLVGERLVTVMFADVRGYTGMIRQQAPAEIVDKLAAFQRWAKQEAERHFGAVDKFAGDAVMATFNISGAHVDHAEHALQAALALRDKAELLEMPIGIGIATGGAVVGALAEGGNISVVGETTNLAARLQAQAGPSEVLLSVETYRRVKDRLEAHDLKVAAEQLQLKGFDSPVSVYRIPHARWTNR